jgi:hypothetical protein
MKSVNQIRTVICMLTFISFIGLNSKLEAQVTIGAGLEPNKGALLDLKERNPTNPAVDNSTSDKGLGMPRVKLTILTAISDIDQAVGKEKEHTGLTVYNTNTDASRDIHPGLYFWDGTRWHMAKEGQVKSSPGRDFFYMPSFNLPLSGDPDLVLKYDLYEEYEKQFTQAGNTSFVSSDASMTAIPKFGRDKLEYVVTAYDGAVIKEVKIDPSGATKGTLRYKCVSSSAPAGSFINIVLVILD